ncbi:hypothetical protein EMIT0158MI4_10430 [Burkholderia ambifaria]
MGARALGVGTGAGTGRRALGAGTGRGHRRRAPRAGARPPPPAAQSRGCHNIGSGGPFGRHCLIWSEGSCPTCFKSSRAGRSPRRCGPRRSPR